MVKRFKLVVHRDERTVVLTGWRAWLAASAVFVLSWILLAFFVFFLIGLTFTAIALLILILPAVLIAAGLNLLLNRKRP